MRRIYVIIQINKLMKNNVKAIESYYHEQEAKNAKDHWNKISNDNEYRIDVVGIM